MKRRSFLPVPLFAPLVAGLAPRTFSIPTLPDDRKSMLVRAGQDRTNNGFRFLDAQFNVVVSGADTEGKCVIFDTVRHEKIGPFLHTHTNCDEWFRVVDGEFKMQAGEETLWLKAGDSLMVPRGMKHAFVKTSEGPARLIVMHMPAVTMEEYFRAALKQADHSPEGLRALAEQHGMTVVGPRLLPD